MAPLAPAFDPDTLLAAVAAEGRAVDLAGAVVHGHGWENAVLETADGWILRFPRNDEVPFAREVAVLDRVAQRLPVPVPRVRWTGAGTRFAAYRKLVGLDFDRAAYLAAPASARDALAASLAGFLAAMHVALTPAEVDELGVPPVDHPRTLDVITRHWARVPGPHRSLVRPLLDRFAEGWVAGAVAGPTVPLHNDFHTGNMVFAPPGPVSVLAGVWDFSCVQVGEPTFDLRYLDGGPRDLLDRVAARYEGLTGRGVDVAAAVVANRVENVLDAVETDRPGLWDAALGRWTQTDAGR